jgi:hypothetical protein
MPIGQIGPTKYEYLIVAQSQQVIYGIYKGIYMTRWLSFTSGRWSPGILYSGREKSGLWFSALAKPHITLGSENEHIQLSRRTAGPVTDMLRNVREGNQNKTDPL